MTENRYKHNADADFYKNISRNKKEYLEKVIEINTRNNEIMVVSKT